MKLSWTYRLKRFLTGNRLLLTVLLVLCAPAGALPVSPPFDERYQYQEITGTDIEEVAWCLTKDDGYRLVCTSPGERHLTVTDGAYNTRRWEMTSTDGETALVAERRDRTIVITGRFNGEPVDKVLPIDDRPWYQATSLSLRGLIDSEDTDCVFWTIRLTTLTVHKIKAIKKGMEQLEAKKDDLLRIRLTLPGVLSPFWKSDYWFDLPGGVFFRFQGPSGPPGSPTTTITRMVD